jgi:colanic acid biosynthesis glycosyl transferase WcaI
VTVPVDETSALSFRACRVAVVTSNFFPEQTGIGRVTTELAEFLSAIGMNVQVVTAMPYYPEWRIYPDYRRLLLHSERHGTILVYRAWHHARPNPSALSRILHEVTLCLVSIPNILRAFRKAEIVYVVTPDLSLACLASLIARALKLRVVLIVQDVMPDAAIELGMLRNQLAIRASAWMATQAYNLASKVYTLGDGMRERIASRTRDKTKIGILPNTIDPDELSPDPAAARRFRERFVPTGSFAVVHTGNMGEKQDLNVLLRAAVRLRNHRDVHFYVFGDGAVRESFVRQMREFNLENVSHFPFLSRAELPGMMYGADIVLISQLPQVIDIVVPSKLVTAMGAGSMIVAACASQSETAALIRESEGGIVVPASDDERLAETILSVKQGVVDTRSLRRNARAYAVRTFDRRAVYGKLISDDFGYSPPRTPSPSPSERESSVRSSRDHLSA